MGITVEMRTQVAQLYTALFGRAPDFDGLGFWTTLIADGASLVEVADTMYDTAPARTYFPIFLSNEEIVESFYLNVLGREADAEGLAFWAAAMDEPGATPGSVIVRMISVVADYAGTDPAGLISQQLFNNKVEVAQHYAEAGGGIEGATAILEGITADPATVTAAIDAIDAGGVNAPVFSAATVNGGTLVMSYSDATTLDATHGPAADDFAVTVAGVARAVSAVAVDATAKTVTLTLASAVTNGQAVTVAYTDPTTGNDTDAIQDAGGNDAATLAATAVTNNTPVNADATAPVFASANVSGTSLVMTYTEANLLDATHVPATSAFAVTVAGAARTVSSVAVDAAAKTVTLTLASAVTSGQAVTVAYTDPTSSNDANAIQDASGNDAATLAATAVTNGGTDTTGPLFVSASVNGAALVMTYGETIDPFNPPVAGAFAVKVAGVARTVNSVVVDSAEKTVTLTLASAVTDGQAVTVAYTDPTSGDDADAIQDALGNDALTLTATAVTNATPDTTAPAFVSAAVTNSTLVMTYSDLHQLDATNKPVPGDFAVTVGGIARTVNSVSVNASAKTVTLTLASAVTNGQVVTVAYTDPSGANNTNAIQDVAGNDAATLGVTAVTNNTPDTTAPVFASAAVNGTSLVMTYTDLNLLKSANPPVAGNFVVMVEGVARTVNAVAVDANAKTVTLTLASAVAEGDVVTVAYTDPTGGNDANAIQDAAGNDAATLVATNVTNNTDNTAPTVTINQAVAQGDPTNNGTINFTVVFSEAVTGFSSADVSTTGSTATIGTITVTGGPSSYNVAIAASGSGTVVASVVSSAALDASSNASAASSSTDNTVTLDNTDPTVTVTGPTASPTLTTASATVALDGTAADNVGLASVSWVNTTNAANGTATGSTTWSVASVALDAGDNVIVVTATDSAGNTATDTITITRDNTAPTVTIDQAGGQGDPTNDGTINFAVIFSEAVTGFTGTDVGVTGTADLTGITKTVTGSGAIYNVEVSGVAGNGTVVASVAADGAEDAAGNLNLVSTSTDDSVTLDTTAPTFVDDATVDGATLVLHFSDLHDLDTTNVPVPGAFTVEVGGVGNAVTNVVVSADGTVTLTLTTAVVNADTVEVAYTDPSGGDDANAIQDLAGNDAVDVALIGVTNITV